MTTLATRNAPQENRAMALVQGSSARLRAALPAHYSPEKLAQVMTVLCVKTPDILACIEESVITSLIQAATLDLDLSPGMNEGYLIPRWNGKIKAMECQFQPGYKGLEKLAVRTGAVLYVQPREVCEADEFEVWHQDDRTHFKHKPAFRGKRGNVTHYYAVAKMADGSPLIEVMTAEEVESIHQRTDNYRKARANGKDEFGPWVTDYDAMARKTVIRKLCKSLPRVSGDPARVRAFEALNAAIEADNVQYEAEPPAALPHHAASNGNDTGHGRTGAYAPPDQVNAYRAWLADFVSDVNAKWLDRWQDADTGEVPPGVKDLLSTYQVSGHLVKWGVAEGLLNAPEDGGRSRQSDGFAAVLWMRNQHQLIAEAEDYGRRKWKEARSRVAAARQAEEPPPAEDQTQEPDDDPEFDEAEVFGGDAGAEG